MTGVPDGFAGLVRQWNEARDAFFVQAFLMLNVSQISGDYVEFGSWGANTIKSAFDAIELVGPERALWAFDSFTGERPPEVEPIDQRGWGAYEHTGPSGVEVFHATCAERGIPRDRYTAVEGFFEDTLPALGESSPPADIALAYVDCNLYGSTRTVFEFLAPRLKHGMVVAFDDYWVYTPDHVSGERAMLHDFERDHPQWRFVRYRDIHHVGVAYVVEDADAIDRR